MGRQCHATIKRRQCTHMYILCNIFYSWELQKIYLFSKSLYFFRSTSFDVTDHLENKIFLCLSLTPIFLFHVVKKILKKKEFICPHPWDAATLALGEQRRGGLFGRDLNGVNVHRFFMVSSWEFNISKMLVIHIMGF